MVVDSVYDPATKKLSMKAAVGAASGTSVAVYVTDNLLDGEWTKFTTVTVTAEGTVELNGLDFSGNSLFVTFGKPPTSSGTSGI